MGFALMMGLALAVGTALNAWRRHVVSNPVAVVRTRPMDLLLAFAIGFGVTLALQAAFGRWV